MTIPSINTLLPTETLLLENGLSLRPRARFALTVYPSDSAAATKPIDEWKLKGALLHFLQSSLSISLAVPEDDLSITRHKDSKNRKRDDAVAIGILLVRDLKFLENGDFESKALQTKVNEWRSSVVDKMNGIELNLEGSKYSLSASIPDCDDFEKTRKAWEELNRGRIDTIILRKVPSRWFSEPRVSSRPSMLVTHSVFSVFGRIRNLEVVEDNGDEDGLISGLHCKVAVQFESYRDFCNAFMVLCSRSLQKSGSRLNADYEMTWAKDVYFRNSRSGEERSFNKLAIKESSQRENLLAVKESKRKRFRE